MDRRGQCTDRRIHPIPERSESNLSQTSQFNFKLYDDTTPLDPAASQPDRSESGSGVKHKKRSKHRKHSGSPAEGESREEGEEPPRQEGRRRPTLRHADTQEVLQIPVTYPDDVGAPQAVTFTETPSMSQDAAVPAVTSSQGVVTSSQGVVTSSPVVMVAPVRSDSMLRREMRSAAAGLAEDALEAEWQVSLREDDKAVMAASFWKTLGEEGERSLHRDQPTKERIKEELAQILARGDVETKEALFQEVKFITRHFAQRRCCNYCLRDNSRFAETAWKVVGKDGPQLNVETCKCGLLKQYHTKAALTKPVERWEAHTNTEPTPVYAFGNMDIPGHYNYLETPEGTRKYLRLDDYQSRPLAVWTLLTKHWKLKEPNMVLSVTGGDSTEMGDNVRLFQTFRDGIIKTAVTTRSWILTEGCHLGSSRMLGDIFQEDLRRSQWSEVDHHATIPLIGVIPWGILADRKYLSGIHVGSDEAVYRYTSIERHSNDSIVPNAMDPYHVVYLFPDDGTHGRYVKEPRVRSELEKYIRSRPLPNESADVRTPVVIIVIGGDHFTLKKLAGVTSDGHQMSAVIVNGSGRIANMLADIYKTLEYRKPRSPTKQYGWSAEEDVWLKELFDTYKQQGRVISDINKGYISTIMHARHLVEVFGVADGDTQDLDKAILMATFGGVSSISVQLNMTLAMGRVDIAEDIIFTESRQKELRDESEMLQHVLLDALRGGKHKFVELLLDQDYGGQLEYEQFLTLQRLHTLHKTNLDPSSIMGKVLRSMCKRHTDGSYMLERHQLLGQVGRILYTLMGDQYRLLYQEREYTKINNQTPPFKLAKSKREEAIWHVFLWAVLGNQPKIAELFLFESSCKIGAALVAHKLFKEMSKVAEYLAETELSEQLLVNAEYYQDLAVTTLDNLYQVDREAAYACVVARMSFHWGHYSTPLAVADNGEAMRFMGHACCQTLLNLVWMQYMDQDTRKWKLLPLFLLCPVNLPFIVFDKRNLSFGYYKTHEEGGEEGAPRGTTARVKAVSEGDGEGSDTGAGEGEVRQRRFEDFKFRMRNYYTCPINKFMMYMISWIVFLGIFTHFLVSELKPIQQWSQISVYEWLVLSWVFCISIDEFKQCFWRASSGPLYHLKWQELEPQWRNNFTTFERLYIVLRIYKIYDWLSDRWNKVDAVMILSYWASVSCRFTVAPVDFGVVRILYSITIIIFFFRLLRIGYIVQAIGPRVVTINAMVRDLAQFMSILFVFIISFGVAFQAILQPNQPPSWNTFINVLWRPYWQMFGELFLDDVTDAMGRPRAAGVGPACTYNRTEALQDPVTLPFCYSWMAPVLLGFFMLITNILLLNLLIAIFSHSFEKIESDAQTVWRFHLYDLVHEYYHQAWLPPPLNILCHLANLLRWAVRGPRKLCYKGARRRHIKSLEKDRKAKSELFAAGDELGFFQGAVQRQAEEDLQEDACHCCYFNTKSMERHEVDIFNQPEYVRDEDLEEKAYKRYLRKKEKISGNRIQQSLEGQDQRLQQIVQDLQDIKRQPRDSHRLENVAARLQAHTSKVSLSRDTQHFPPIGQSALEISKVQLKIDNVDARVGRLEGKLDQLLESMGRSLDLLKSGHVGITQRTSTLSGTLPVTTSQ